MDIRVSFKIVSMRIRRSRCDNLVEMMFFAENLHRKLEPPSVMMSIANDVPIVLHFVLDFEAKLAYTGRDSYVYKPTIVQLSTAECIVQGEKTTDCLSDGFPRKLSMLYTSPMFDVPGIAFSRKWAPNQITQCYTQKNA